MATWARIEQGQAVEVLTGDNAPVMHPSIIWVAASADVDVGWLYDGATWSPPAPEPIAEIAARAEAEVRRQAAATRDAWRTPGKDAVYQRKLDEAEAWRAAGEPVDLTAYPHIAAEMGITAPTAAELVALWEVMAAAWIVASAQVEATEQGALKAIREAVLADDVAAVEAALAGLSWPEPAP